MQSVQMENPKVFSSLSIVWITVTNFLNLNAFVSPIMTTEQEMFNERFLLESTSPFNLILDFYWLNLSPNLATLDLTYCLRHT